MEPRAPDLALPGSVLTDPASAMASGAYLFFLMPRPEEEAPAFLFIPGIFPAVFMEAGSGMSYPPPVIPFCSSGRMICTVFSLLSLLRSARCFLERFLLPLT